MKSDPGKKPWIHHPTAYLYDRRPWQVVGTKGSGKHQFIGISAEKGLRKAGRGADSIGEASFPATDGYFRTS